MSERIFGESLFNQKPQEPKSVIYDGGGEEVMKTGLKWLDERIESGKVTALDFALAKELTGVDFQKVLADDAKAKNDPTLQETKKEINKLITSTDQILDMGEGDPEGGILNEFARKLARATGGILFAEKRLRDAKENTYLEALGKVSSDRGFSTDKGYERTKAAQGFKFDSNQDIRNKVAFNAQRALNALENKIMQLHSQNGNINTEQLNKIRELQGRLTRLKEVRG